MPLTPSGLIVVSCVVFVDPADLDGRDVGVSGHVVPGEIIVDIVAELRVHDPGFVQCHAEAHGHAADELGPGGGGVDDPPGGEYSGHAVHAHFAGCGVDPGLDELGAE
jgi:hypothetical protein